MFRFSVYLCLCAIVFCLQGYSLKVTNPFKPGTAVVSIGDYTQILTRSMSCKADYWGNNQENSCTCCIVKYGLKPKGQFKYTGDHISHCLKKKHCSKETLENIAESLGTQYDPARPDFLVARIIDKANVTPTVGTIGKEYHDNGKLNAQGVVQALSILAQRQKIPSTAKSIQECFQVQSLNGGGSQTLQLFLVSKNSYCGRQSKIGKQLFEGVYIVKELKKGQTEIKNTTQVKKSFLGKYALNNPDKPEGFPSIALDEISFVYKDDKGNPHYLAVLTLAPGNSLFNILRNFSESYKQHKEKGTLGSSEYKISLNRAQHAMMSLGQQLGHLHAAYMTRDKKDRLSGKSKAVHGDMHSNNIFETVENHNIIFIDGETFSIGLKSPRSIGKDLLRIYLFSTIRSASHQNPRKGNVGQTYWHEEIIKPFLREYIRAYAFMDQKGNITRNFNQDNFEDVIKILRKTFSLSGGGADPEAFLLKAGPFSSLWAYRKYVSKILNEAESEIKSNPQGGGLNPIQQLFLQGKKGRIRD